MLTGKWVVLRALERDDLKLIHKWQNDEEVMRLARSQPDHAISMEALAAELEKNLKGEDATTRRFGIPDGVQYPTAVGRKGIRALTLD